MVIAKLYIAVYNIIKWLYAYKHIGHYLSSAKVVTMLCMLNITIYHNSEYRYTPQSEK